MMTKPSFLIGGAFWLYLCLCFVLLMSAPVFTGKLIESDDYMRMVRVFDLLDGHPDINYIQPRLGHAGAGVAWSPLVDAPLALLTLFFSQFTTRLQAAMITATLWPPVLLLAFIAAASWYTRSVLDEKTARWMPVTLLLLWGLLTQFFPGRIDHHNWQLIILVLTFGCLFRAYNDPVRTRWPVAAGFFAALGWSIGAEIIPWVALAAIVSGLYWLIEGHRFLKTNLAFGGALLAGTIAFLPLTRGFSGFMVSECDGISRFHLTLAAAVPFCWLALRFMPEKLAKTIPQRFLCAALPAAVTGYALYRLFPGCLHDPYGVADPELRRIWLTQVNEVRPAWDYFDRPALILFYIGPLLLALFVCLQQARRGVNTLLAAMIVGLLWALGLSLWQIRTAYLGQALAILPLTFMLSFAGTRFAAAWRKRGSGKKAARKRRLLAIAWFCAGLAFFSFSLAEKKPAAEQRPDMTRSCNVENASRVLNMIDKPQTIAAYVIDGSELLFRTPHRVLAASYHRDAEGILAAHRFFMASNDETAKALAEKYDIGLALVCVNNLPYWKRTSGIENPLAVRLWDEDTPSWLQLAGEGSGFKVYKVR